jgi:hypothetical protein
VTRLTYRGYRKACRHGATRRARTYASKRNDSRKEAKLISGIYAIAGSEEGGPSSDTQTHPLRKLAPPA